VTGVAHRAISLNNIRLNDRDQTLPISFCHIGGMIRIGGIPTANVRVGLFDRSGILFANARTGADGRFLFPRALGHNGAYRVTAYEPHNNNPIQHPRQIMLKNTNVLNIDFHLNRPPLYTISGHVMEGGQPYQNAWLNIFNLQGTWLCNAKTDSHGNYTLGPLVGDRHYIVQLYKKITLEPIGRGSNIKVQNANIRGINFNLPGPQQSNRPPNVVRISISCLLDRDFGSHVYTSYSLSAVTLDPDGDKVTAYKWMYEDGREFDNSNRSTVIYNHMNYTSRTFSRIFKLSVKDEHGVWSPIPTEFVLTFKGIRR